MLARFLHALRIYGKLQLVHIRTHLEYEADFWIGIVGVMLTHGAGLAFVWILFGRVPEVAGWNLWEIAFLYSLAIIPRGLVEILCDGQWRLRLMVNRGEFDRLLVRPVSPALQLITQMSSIHGLGSVLLGLVVVTRAVVELDVVWGPAQYVFLLTTIFGSVVLIGSINFATNCIAFWDPSANSAFPFLVGHTLELVKFPITLYGRLVQVLLTWVLPFAFVSYYPGLVLLGRTDATPWLGYLSPLAGPAVGLVSSLIWRRGLMRYQGAGH